ncbi:MAG: HAD family hydrolase [Bacillota bacterium]|nr:HAD family hydrolase [Bacillota bacterium]
MLRTILFDLDGTLLPMDPQVFLSHYMQALAARMSRWLAPQEFIRHLLASTAAMVASRDPGRTNEEVFWEDFLPRLGVEREEVRPVIEEFYRVDFPALRAYTCPTPLARRLVEAFYELGCELVIATNPIFPRGAIVERLRWAGVADFPYRLITSYEEMHFCKPNPDYYREILERVGRRPEECLMIGNDVEEDLVAARLGLKTALVEDCLLNPRGEEPAADFRGSLEELVKLVSDGGLAALAGEGK